MATRRKIRYHYFHYNWIFKTAQEINEKVIWASYVNCTTVNRRLNRHKYWQDRIYQEETLPERLVYLMEFSAERAFSKATHSEWWHSKKDKYKCNCWRCYDDKGIESKEYTRSMR